MRGGRGKRNRTGRWLLILVALGLCIPLLIINALILFPQGNNLSSHDLAYFGFSALTALTYLTVGSMVWLFARQRHVARLLFCFSCAMMVSFANETASSMLHHTFFSVLTGVSVVLALTSFSLLLLIFPFDYLAAAKNRQQSSRAGRTWWSGRILFGVYIGGHIVFASLTIGYAVVKHVLAIDPPDWLSTTVNYYYVVSLACIILTIIGSYCLSRDLRIRQQLQLFVVGVTLACAPVLFLTALPQTLMLPAVYIVDARLSSLPLLFLPLAMGYAILRYQILVFDRYIRRIVAWAASAISLALLCYLVVALSSKVFFTPDLSLMRIIFVTAAMALLGPTTWWAAHQVTERLFFPEIRYYWRHVQQPELLMRETFDLNEASEVLILTIMQTFETQEVCLYVLDEGTGYYHLAPALERYRTQGVMRGQLLWDLAGFSELFGSEGIELVKAQRPVMLRLAAARRPLFLHEALEGTDREPARYLLTTSHEKVDPLLVQVRAQGKMIGVLCLGERGDNQTYAGTDFEVLHMLLSRFSSILETARLYVQASRHVTVLNTLYSSGARLERTYQRIEEVAQSYATVAAEAMQATVGIWLYRGERQALHRVIHTGNGPMALSDEWIKHLQEHDWEVWFHEGGAREGDEEDPQRPGPLARDVSVPLAWLPLCKGQKRLGLLLLSFSHSHVFSLEERRILEMFAGQCAAAMENAQITIALRTAYERQKELDRLKDQFIMTASHELRTPLTAVQGYIELLNQYNSELSSETRTEFIQKAHRGCDELALMVGNIMDASRIQIEAERIRLAPVELASSVRHVMEILEAVTTREKRPVHLAISPGLYILADELRLRQILLNLVSNALKYSPDGTSIQIMALQGQGLVKISVRDYGLGVPPGDQERLFERFIRLERDMNSPIRGAGLGLYITKRLTEAMGGRLWVESSGIPGEGSTFSFTLQRANPPAYQAVGELPSVAHRER